MFSCFFFFLCDNIISLIIYYASYVILMSRIPFLLLFAYLLTWALRIDDAVCLRLSLSLWTLNHFQLISSVFPEVLKIQNRKECGDRMCLLGTLQKCCLFLALVISAFLISSMDTEQVPALLSTLAFNLSPGISRAFTGLYCDQVFMTSPSSQCHRLSHPWAIPRLRGHSNAKKFELWRFSKEHTWEGKVLISTLCLAHVPVFSCIDIIVSFVVKHLQTCSEKRQVYKKVCINV